MRIELVSMYHYEIVRVWHNSNVEINKYGLVFIYDKEQNLAYADAVAKEVFYLEKGYLIRIEEEQNND